MLADVKYLIMEVKKTRRVRHFKEHEDTKDKQLSKLAISQISKIFPRSYFRVFFGKPHRVAALTFFKAIEGIIIIIIIIITIKIFNVGQDIA